MNTVSMDTAQALIVAVAAKQITERQALAYLKAELSAEQLALILEAHKPPAPESIQEAAERLKKQMAVPAFPFPSPMSPNSWPNAPIRWGEGGITTLGPVTCKAVL